MAVAADGSIQPYLAKTMTTNSTFDVWTMTLRPGVHLQRRLAAQLPGGAGQLQRPEEVLGS